MGEAKWFPHAFLAKIWPVPIAKIIVITVQFLSVDSVQSKHLWIAILEDAYIAKKTYKKKLKYHEKLKKDLVKTKQMNLRNISFEFQQTVQILSVDSVQSRHLWIATLDDEFIAIKTLKMETEISWKNFRKTEEKSRENAEMNLLLLCRYLEFRKRSITCQTKIIKNFI